MLVQRIPSQREFESRRVVLTLLPVWVINSSDIANDGFPSRAQALLHPGLHSRPDIHSTSARRLHQILYLWRPPLARDYRIDPRRRASFTNTRSQEVALEPEGVQHPTGRPATHLE